MRGLPLSRTTLKARYDAGELVSPTARAKRQPILILPLGYNPRKRAAPEPEPAPTNKHPPSVAASPAAQAPAETAKFLRMLKTRE